MSIEDDVRARQKEGRLRGHKPLLRGDHPRVVVVEANLMAELEAGAVAVGDPDAFRIGQLARDLDRFASGALITIGHGKEKTCFLKRLDPASDEVWEIRSRDPKPSCRVFGRFATTDVFVVTNASFRAPLGPEGSQEWKEQIRNTKTVWRQLFPTYNPHSGASINDYVSRNVIELGRLR